MIAGKRGAIIDHLMEEVQISVVQDAQGEDKEKEKVGDGKIIRWKDISDDDTVAFTNQTEAAMVVSWFEKKIKDKKFIELAIQLRLT